MFGILVLSTLVVFSLLWCLLNLFYHRTRGKWSFVDRIIEKFRAKGESPFIKKYGLFGLALVMAIPLPTIGVYGGTILSWLGGVKWWSALIAIVAGTSVSNTIVLFSALGIAKLVA